MQRRLGRRDYLLLTVVSIAFLVLAVQLPYGTRGFDHPQQGAHWRLLEAPGRMLGWGGVALLIIGIPYALVAWLKGRAPGRAISALGALVFGAGVGGLAGVLASTPTAGGGIAGGALAHMLSDSLGVAIASILLGLIAIPGLFLSLAPLLLDTGFVARPGSGTPASERTSSGEGAGQGAGPATGGRASTTLGIFGKTAGAGNLPPVLVKPWYPERHVGPDGEELPMNLGGSDVGPIRYRDPPPLPPAPQRPAAQLPEVESTPAAILTPPPTPPPTPLAMSTVRTPIPKAMPPPAPPPSAGTRKPPVISGVRYRDEEAAPPAPLTQTRTAPDSESDDSLPDGVRFAAEPAPPPAPPPAPSPAPEPVPDASATTPHPPERLPSASDVLETTFLPYADVAESVNLGSIDPAPVSSGSRHDDVVASWVAAHPLPVPDPVESSPPPRTSVAELPRADAVPSDPAAASESLHPSVVGHRRKLAESGIFEGTSPAADRPGRPPKPKPRPAAAKDWREALHGLFSSLPVEELPPIRVPDDLVGTSAADEAAARVDAPGQMKLFDASDPGAAGGWADGRTADGRATGTRDALFEASVDAALERGTASLVLLKRKLGVGYARAASLMDALVTEGVLGEMTASGSRPTLLTQAEWNRRKRRSFGEP